MSIFIGSSIMARIRGSMINPWGSAVVFRSSNIEFEGLLGNGGLLFLNGSLICLNTRLIRCERGYDSLRPFSIA